MGRTTWQDEAGCTLFRNDVPMVLRPGFCSASSFTWGFNDGNGSMQLRYEGEGLPTEGVHKWFSPYCLGTPIMVELTFEDQDDLERKERVLRDEFDYELDDPEKILRGALTGGWIHSKGAPDSDSEGSARLGL